MILPQFDPVAAPALNPWCHWAMSGTWCGSPRAGSSWSITKYNYCPFFGLGCYFLNHVRDRESGRSPVPWEFWSKPLEMEAGESTQNRRAQQRWRNSACLPIISAKESSRNQGNLWVWKHFQRETNLEIFAQVDLVSWGSSHWDSTPSSFPLPMPTVCVSEE